MPEAFRDIDSFSIGWRCLLCGEIVDHVILQNRTMPLTISPSSVNEEDTTDWQSSEDEYELGAMT